MKCIIVEKEVPARRALARLCEKIEDLQVIACCSDGLEAAQVHERESVDLLLVGTNLDTVSPSSMVAPRPQVIVVTDGNDSEGLLAVQASDILSKPLSIGRLRKAVERVRLRSRLLRPEESTDEVYLRNDGRLLRIRYNDILFAEAVGMSVVLHTPFESYDLDMTLQELSYKLEDKRFEKVNRSFIVNLSKVLSVGETSLSLADRDIPISRAMRPMLVRIIDSVS